MKKAYHDNPDKKRAQMKKAYLSKDDETIKKKFWNKQACGLSYICCSCHRILFKTSVVPFEKDIEDDDVVKGIRKGKLDYCVSTDTDFKCEDRYWLCHNCKNVLKDGKMPNMCHANGLFVKSMPPELQD